MLLSNPGAGEFADELAHFKCQEDTLLSSHIAVNLILNGLSLGSCIADRHRKMLSRTRCARNFSVRLASAGDGREDDERFFARRDCVGERSLG